MGSGNVIESNSTENGSSGGNVPFTLSSGYDSRFQGITSSLNKNIGTTFTNATPLILDLIPYGEHIHAESFLSSHSSPFPIGFSLGLDFTPIASLPIHLPPGSSALNLDNQAPMCVDAPPFTNNLGGLMYDFGDPSFNWRMYHHGKIYYFKFTVSDVLGNIIEQGYLRHNFYGETQTANNILTLFGSEWQIATTSVVGFPPNYAVAAMYNTTTHEMCLTNHVGYTDHLPSTVNVLHPVTGAPYTLSFTSTSAGMSVTFM